MRTATQEIVSRMLALLALAFSLSAIPEAEAASWGTNNAMTTARYGQTATLLPNGKILVAGGRTNGGPIVASAELYDPATGLWAATGAMNSRRTYHTATLLPNGKVLIAGGWSGSSGYLSSAELYDPTSGTWTNTGSLTMGREFHTATLLSNGKVLIAGGTASGNWLSSAELYDPIAGTWTTTGPLATARSYQTATLLPTGKVLIAGGRNGFYLSSAELYDPTSGTWTNTSSLATPRVGHTTTLLPNGKVLVAGGWDDNNGGLIYLSSAELYDPASGTWTNTGSMSMVRLGHAATLLPNGTVMVTGGEQISGHSYFTNAEFYDPSTGTWSITGTMASGRWGHTATLLPNGKVLIAGGQDNNDNALSTVESYDPANGTWTNTGSLATTTRYNHTATLLPNGKVLVAGGWKNSFGGPFLSTAELYDPSSGAWTATGSMSTGRTSHTATLLPNGKVLVTGGDNVELAPSNVNLSGAELYDPANGTWTSTGSMISPRNSHTATLLANGKVLVAGGYNGANLSSAELYDPPTGTWTNTGTMAAAQFGSPAVLLPSEKVLIVGGDATSNSVELYDPSSGTWTVTSPLNVARSGCKATLLPNGLVLVSGGGVSSTELYDSTTGVWALTGSMSTGRFATATLLPNGKVLVAGGGAPSAELYDPTTGIWTLTSSMSTDRWLATATVLPNGKVLEAGGYIGVHNYLSSAELYDVGLGFNSSWQPQIASSNSPLLLPGSLVLSGSQFRGVSEGSCGSTTDSSTDYPLIQLRALENGQTTFLPPTIWSTNSFTSSPLTNFPPGYAMVTVFVNGIPSAASILDVSSMDFSGFAITSIIRQGNDVRIAWTTYAGKTNVVQVASGAADGSYSNSFADLSAPIIPAGTGVTATNYLDVGGAAGFARYYRIRLVP